VQQWKKHKRLEPAHNGTGSQIRLESTKRGEMPEGELDAENK
jgi:hypothetical protein